MIPRILTRLITKKQLVPFITGIALVAFVACGGSDTGLTSVASTATAVPAAVAQDSSSGANSRVAPELRDTESSSVSRNTGTDFESRAGGTFRRLWADPPTLDPHQVTDTTSAGLVVELFSGLVKLSKELEIVPDLAESWVISGDGTIYTFTLRENLKFSDGSPLTAADFKWSWERAANPDTESTVADVYLGDIVGINAIVEGDAVSSSAIKVIDERTLQVTIDGAKPYFIAKLTYPTAFVLKQENVEAGGDRWTDTPVGTGPFVLDDYRVGERIVFSRNENFNGRKAYLDKVLFNLAGGIAMAMYETDEIDITGVGLADLDRVQDPNEPLNKDLVNIPPGFSISYIGFNTEKAPFDDMKFRQALNLAVNKELIAESVYAGLVKPAYGILPPNFPGFTGDIEGLRFDPDDPEGSEERARAVLAESKYADPDTRPRIVITIPGTGGSPSLDVEIVADMWRNVLGVEAEIQQVEWATYLQDLNRERLQAFGGLGWEADYPDPQDFLDILFHSESPGNHGNFSSDIVDSLVERARTEPDPQLRTDLYQQAEQEIITQAAWLPLWFDTEGKGLIKPYVKDYKFTPIIVPKLGDVWIDK
ncbi:MAG: peptide ABC transporter substrate-binding protein [Chloroflexi bacterium]|nr:peptide ABC transporter substrate-binding protein [Chloroflexota bacterium]